MAVTIGSNILSQTVQRNLSRSSESLSTASERLSSGQRINKASDDAAGLAIAMSLNKDRVLAKTAQRNVSDGISMISILGAGLASQKEILFRMAELSEQSANGTYTNRQRESLQREYSSLMDEFDRIADSTEFNGVKLLRSKNQETIQFMAGITGADTSLLQITAANSHRYAGEYQMRSDFSGDNYSDNLDAGNMLHEIGRDRSFIDSSLYVYQGAEVKTIGSQGAEITLNFVFTQNEPSQQIILLGTAKRGEFYESIGTPIATYTTGVPKELTIAGVVAGENYSYSLDLSGITLSDNYFRADKPPSSILQSDVARPSNIGFTNIIGRNQARNALVNVRNRIDDLSAIEGRYGAVQSRLTVAFSQLAASGENFAAAASRIIDADIAAESANVVRTQILQQTSASLLGQANLAPQIGLQLLQNA